MFKEIIILFNFLEFFNRDEVVVDGVFFAFSRGSGGVADAEAKFGGEF